MSQSKISQQTDKIPLPEWIVAGVGLIIVLFAIAFLLYKAFFVSGGAPVITFKIDNVVSQDGGSLVLATVSNTGGETVTDLSVGGSAGDENREVIIDFIPARSSRKFGMFFSSEPEVKDVKLKAGAYQTP